MSRGLTLLEVVVATAVSVALGGVTLGLLAASNDQVSAGLARTEAACRAGAAAQVVKRQLRGVSRGSLTLSTPAPYTGAFTAVRFRRVTGYDPAAGGAQLGPWEELRFELDGDESWSSTPADDDRDGLVDEGRLVLSRDADGDGAFGAAEQVAVVAQGVNGSTFGLSLPSGSTAPQVDDGLLRVTFSVQARTRRGEVVERTQALHIPLRNE